MDARPATQSAHVQGLGHIVLYVSNLHRSTAFYRDLLGWATVSTPEVAPVAIFRAGETHHDLLLIEVGERASPLPQGRHLGLYHFGVKVGDSDEELREVVERLRARPDLASIHGLVDGGFIHSAYVLDPDGNEIRAVHRRTRLELERPRPVQRGQAHQATASVLITP